MCLRCNGRTGATIAYLVCGGGTGILAQSEALVDTTLLEDADAVLLETMMADNEQGIGGWRCATECARARPRSNRHPSIAGPGRHLPPESTLLGGGAGRCRA